VIRRLLLATCTAGVIAAAPIPRRPGRLPVVVPNDNRTPAGHARGDTLRLALVVEMADWYPGSDAGSSIAVAAFAEEGAAPRIPGPLIRVTEGTVIDVTVRNALSDSTVHLSGLHAHPITTDALLVLAPGAGTRLRFTAGTPGTYLYAARIGTPSDEVERETAIGAFVVDPATGAPPDRVFVMNIWSDPVDSVTWREALAINGRSFPYTERITATVGDSVRWRWINGSVRNHPMHLHGFYFRVDAKGDGRTDSAYAPVHRRLVVTEDMAPFTTMRIVWSPHRDGNWLFHCHIGFHVAPEAQIDPPARAAHAHLSGDFERHMAGLVLALVVEPAPGWAAVDGPPRRHLRLFAQEGTPRGRALRALGYVIAEDGRVPAPDSVDIPGRTLVLTRGEPTDVTIVNRMPEPTAVHWHGLELESYSDGMAGWSGYGLRVAPPVMPGDSFTAHLTLERAGTFMYHTHLNDYEQLTSGLYGPIVVLEPGETFDSTTDHVFVVGWDGPEPPRLLLNGDSRPVPRTLRGGVTHRLRLVNIGMAIRIEFALLRDTTLMAWRPRAWDGADLPPEQATLRPARTVVAVGQTADFLFEPPGPGWYRLVLRGPDGTTLIEQALVVR
jgi:FtsP/CotA-like multicopper oxidase with cupredoxin domain